MPTLRLTVLPHVSDELEVLNLNWHCRADSVCCIPLPRDLDVNLRSLRDVPGCSPLALFFRSRVVRCMGGYCFPFSNTFLLIVVRC